MPSSSQPVTRRHFGWLTLATAASLRAQHEGIPMPGSSAAVDVAIKPMGAQAARVLAALAAIGQPLAPHHRTAVETAANDRNEQHGAAAIQTILDRLALITVTINPESRLSVVRGSSPAELVQHGWRAFLIKVVNQSGTTPPITVRSPQAGRMGRTSSLAITGVHDFTNGAVDAVEARRRWIALSTYDLPPMTPRLSGLAVEYRILQIYSRDAGQREASLTADCSFGDADLGFRSTLPVLFHIAGAHAVTLRLRDEHGAPCMASLLIHDHQGRTYPEQGKRDLPDLFFQPQIYRRDGEPLELAAGTYDVTVSRGPEYLPLKHSLQLANAPAAITANLQRWIDPSSFGYYSGDTHIHAAGCAHYESPTEGVTPEVMERQALGEALDLGAVLNWGPGFAYQKRFFSGHANAAHVTPAQSAPRTLLRYDVEVSGFPSSHCGHLVLLRLQQDMYPDTQSIDDWPSWNLPILRWAKSQGAVTGYAHSGHGMVTPDTSLPNYKMPPFDSSGTNEFLVDVTHPGMVDFLSGCDTMPFAELNAWYHTLNSGYRTAFAGETDFPCLTDQCVGGGRSYAKLAAPPSGDEGYTAWLQALTSGGAYASDGRSHIFDFALQPTSGKSVVLTASVAAYLPGVQDTAARAIAQASPFAKPYWHLERARKPGSRQVAVELIVNGQSVGRQNIEADGTPQPVRFEHRPSVSSWYALRIYPSAHTQPLFHEVDGKPVRPSRQSAAWCRNAIDVLWREKEPRIRPAEQAEASAAYDHARRAYESILREAEAE